MSKHFCDEAYIRRVVEQHSSLLLRLAYSYLASIADAEDVVQEVYLALLERHRPFLDEQHECAWLVRVTINKCKNSLKTPWRTRRAPMPANPSTPLPEELPPVMDAVKNLPQNYRLPIHLHYCEGWSTNEIAAILGIAPVTARTRLHRGRTLLKAALEGGNS